MRRPVALITGPTSGIGAGFARYFAADGYDLVLVARDADRLAHRADELRNEAGHGVEVMPADLADSADRAKVADRLTAGVRVLVNNAGIGTSGKFWTTDPELLQAQLDINVTAVMQLTRAALPPMLNAHDGAVINVASVAGLRPGQGYPAYSASKAWVVSFTEGLAGGLKGTGVSVHAVCPGMTRTDWHRRAGIDVSSVPSFWWLEVDDVIRKSMADIARGKVISVPGVQNKALGIAGRITPRNPILRTGNVIRRNRGRT
ncbi:SDR family NAD(P)-dependent oxidoreductase [uncultured Mycobacterium sp.]|uniref:SDR family NAD(P)-dependent oxidoreductase n=1 Tax=uncultured Mycobacterium sp. TaxID=171292 RepID=UPI0035CC2A9C